MLKEPRIKVGIVSGDKIQFSLSDVYVTGECDFCAGNYEAFLTMDGKISVGGIVFGTEVEFAPVVDESLFSLEDVMIGVSFHWQRNMRQSFRGALLLVAHNSKIVCVNNISLEQYLESVISSEMRSTSFLEFLKAHAVISRSWLLAQLPQITGELPVEKGIKQEEAEDMTIVWYDREDHNIFDVCADDHCQRYQGVVLPLVPQIREALSATRGEVLISGGRICDARFSKCCGGVTELYESCWDDTPHQYLQSFADSEKISELPDLRDEAEAEKFIMSSPDAFCNSDSKDILSQILNDYDRETADFFRWEISYTQQDISTIIKNKTGTDFGLIKSLTPLKRGPSGRIVLLRIDGTKCSQTIGKELYIRRILSLTHLYSSAFVVKVGECHEGIPCSFTLHGAGWGHGVGLCQIGAAVMASRGYDYERILSHYFAAAKLCKIYV
ncbi:MAG: SpoIID/LytB domain-containing protein [Bacteroidales bacterium]